MRTITITASGSAQQVTTQNLYASAVVISASGTTEFVGDSTVTATNGQKLSTTPLIIPCSNPRGILLSTLWVIGSAADKINILYEASE